MKFLNNFKNQKERFLKDSISKEEWIEPSFVVSASRTLDITEEEWNEFRGETYINLLEVVRSTVMQHQLSSYYISNSGAFNKNVTIKDINKNNDAFKFLIRFITPSADKDDPGLSVKEKEEDDVRSYLFSPLHFERFKGLFDWIEQEIIRYTRKLEGEHGIIFSYENNISYMIYTDHLRYVKIPLKRRLELFIKYPKIDKEIFKKDFKEQIDWMLVFKDTDSFEGNEKFFDEVEQIKKEILLKKKKTILPWRRKEKLKNE